MKQTLPRGLRNNNPGNLRRSADNWKGLRPEQTDPNFFQFTAPEWGYRALIKTLQTYRKKYGLQTIAELISRWAPANENNTSAYIRSVCREMQTFPTWTTRARCAPWPPPSPATRTGWMP